MGQVVSTLQALHFCRKHRIDISTLLVRHASGDWGDITTADKCVNDAAVLDGRRILSAYSFSAGRVWVLTEATGENGVRASTCIMLPSDY
ncbi:hypothetical protein IP87_02895 [beta proteobacterium AAP121]|nr:hypothetical protein IP80_11335 [beta proteobacterium AAP65]KPG00365.1 hypothetical protein IP87_02895 [beta proteobacterium AAP121]